MSSLNTFGSILTYAINLETSLRDYYEAAGNNDLARDSDKRRSTLERIRREYVVEITLEPIEGLDEADYNFNFQDHAAEAQTENERMAVQFYSDVAPKINVRQAQRALERCARQHADLA
ncbi:MAG: hypothetical protein K8L99_08530 [Anaerolineae bacterium]|nr:hypothetical protein [Anaerolineae bacterium]